MFLPNSCVTGLDGLHKSSALFKVVGFLQQNILKASGLTWICSISEALQDLKKPGSPSGVSTVKELVVYQAELIQCDDYCFWTSSNSQQGTIWLSTWPNQRPTIPLVKGIGSMKDIWPMLD